MRCLILTLFIVGLSLSTQWDVETEFNEFVAKYKKSYSNEEREVRKLIFADNLLKIEKMTEELISLGHTGSFPSITKFSDMTLDEFNSRVLMPKASSFDQPCTIADGIPPTPVDEWPILDIPSSFDWREKGAVTPAKDQGSVGTCWAFSTTGNIEGQWFLHTNGTQLISLSEEQLNDCDGYDCGVFGGWPCRAYQYVIKTGGLMTEQSYPYCVGTGACYPCSPPGYNETFCGPSPTYCNQTEWPCKAHQGQTFPASISGWKLFGTNESELQAQLIANGPLSVLMDASGFPPLEYHEYGVYDPWSCDPTALDHAVLLVGYGDDDGPYWIVKNSWGADWCDNGFFKIRRGSGTCGINQAVTSAYV